MNTDFQDQDLGYEGWDCPTCLQPFPPHHDYECGTCEAKASEHLRVTTMCKLLRETQRRENSLIIQLSDAKTSVEHWQEKAKQADEAANDLVAELIDTRREWKEELAAERALADRLAQWMLDEREKYRKLDPSSECKCADCRFLTSIDAQIDAWKEARSE